MKHSEFWRAVEAVYGSGYGRSLVVDLVLPSLRATAAQALDDGVSPRIVWDALCDETEVGDQARWAYRIDTRERP